MLKKFNQWFMNSDLPMDQREACWEAWCAWYTTMEDSQ